jgi:hypothetical protein
MNQAHVGNGRIFTNPNRVLILVISHDPTFFQAMNHNAILDVAALTNVEGTSFIGSNGTSGRN